MIFGKNDRVTRALDRDSKWRYILYNYDTVRYFESTNFTNLGTKIVRWNASCMCFWKQRPHVTKYIIPSKPSRRSLESFGIVEIRWTTIHLCNYCLFVTSKMYSFSSEITWYWSFLIVQILYWTGWRPLKHICITMTSYWARLRLKSQASPLFAILLVKAQIKENIRALCLWPLCGEFTGHRWISRTKS